MDVAAARHVQGAPGHSDVAGGRLAQGRRHERRRGHRRAGQDRAVAEERPDALTQAGVEDGHHQAQVRVDLLGAQRRMEVAQVILAQQGQGAGRLHLRGGEGVGVQFRPLDDPYLGQAGDAGPLALLPGAQQNRDFLAVGGGQFLDDPGGEGVVAAHDKMVAAGRDPGEWRHGAILTAIPAHTGRKGWTASPENGAPGSAQGEAIRPSSGGSRLAAPRSSRNRVRCLPRAPAAGTWTGPTSDRASRTAPAFSGPAARIQTSRALRIEGRVSVSRIGGGFGAPRTATTLRSSYSAGMAGNRDATWPSGPMPSNRTSNPGTGP